MWPSTRQTKPHNLWFLLCLFFWSVLCSFGGTLWGVVVVVVFFVQQPKSINILFFLFLVGFGVIRFGRYTLQQVSCYTTPERIPTFMATALLSLAGNILFGIWHEPTPWPEKCAFGSSRVASTAYQWWPTWSRTDGFDRNCSTRRGLSSSFFLFLCHAQQKINRRQETFLLFAPTQNFRFLVCTEARLRFWKGRKQAVDIGLFFFSFFQKKRTREREHATSQFEDRSRTVWNGVPRIVISFCILFSRINEKKKEENGFLSYISLPDIIFFFFWLFLSINKIHHRSRFPAPAILRETSRETSY